MYIWNIDANVSVGNYDKVVECNQDEHTYIVCYF